jgi:hypothetical protein
MSLPLHQIELFPGSAQTADCRARSEHVAGPRPSFRAAPGPLFFATGAVQRVALMTFPAHGGNSNGLETEDRDILDGGTTGRQSEIRLVARRP